MPCDQHLLVQRLAVDDPAALKRQPWAAHLAACPDCRRERYALERSLAVFRQLDALPASGRVCGPSWETFSRALAQTRHRSPFIVRLRAPLAAASLLAAMGTGMLLWPLADEGGTARPARIVKLRPEQEVQLQRVLQTSLDDPTSPVGTRTPHLTPVRTGEPTPARFAVQEPAAPASGEAQVAGAALGSANPARVADRAAQPPLAADAGPAGAGGEGSSARGDQAAVASRPSASRPAGTRSEIPVRLVNAPASGERQPARLAAAPAAPVRPGFAPMFGSGDRGGNEERERAPVILFRSLQQRGNNSPPVQVLPVFSPHAPDPATTLIRSLLVPRPIR